MPNYIEILKNLQKDYPLCNLELTKPNDNVNRNSKVKGNCNKENCSNTFEIGISRIEEQNIYCKSCKSIDNSIINYLEKFENLQR